jgi:hypothetical protein
VATFNTNYVTYDMLPELTDSDLMQLGVVIVGWRLLFCRATKTPKTSIKTQANKTNTTFTITRTTTRTTPNKTTSYY